MQLSTVLTTLVAAAATVSAAPLEQAKRECPVQYPRSLGFPINYEISKTISPPSETKAIVAFNIPPNSWGCQLIAKFPAGYPIQKSGASRVNVFNDETGSLVGTLDFTSFPDRPSTTFINSFVCKDNMQFTFAIASADQPGSVKFQEVLGAGLVMQYNC